MKHMFAFKTVLLFTLRGLWRHGLCYNTTSIKHWKLNFSYKKIHTNILLLIQTEGLRTEPSNRNFQYLASQLSSTNLGCQPACTVINNCC